jgi:predicted dehydrogenase
MSNYDDLLTLKGLQAVVIATPSRSHAQMVRSALDRGLHVFCEKPLTLSSAESRDLSVRASDRGLVAQVGYHNRFIGTFMEVGRLLAEQAVGKVTHVLAEAYGPVVVRPSKPTWRGKAGEGGGCLYDYAAHPINLLNWYFGKVEGCGGAYLKKLFSNEVEDEVYATLKFRDNITGQLSVNWSDASVRKMTTRISIWGDGGKIYADRQELQLFQTASGRAPGYTTGWNNRYITDLTPPTSFYLRGEEYTSQLEAFGNAIQDRGSVVKNDFGASAITDAAIDIVRNAAMAGQDQGDGKIERPVRRIGIINRVLGR